MKLGAHLSIAGNISNALRDAKTIDANVLQIFSGPPRSWQFPTRSSQEIKKFRHLAKQNHVSDIFVHAKYLINLASSNPTLQNSSVTSLVQDLKLSRKVGAQGVIFHPHPKNFNLLVKNIKRVLSETPPSTFLILENSAQTKLEKIGQIIKAIKSPRLKFCLDTAHAYEAGYDLAEPRGIQKLFQIIKKQIGFKRWMAIHANDSKTKLNSRHDQHADIGKGKIGKQAFSVFLNHPISSKLPFILETPAIKTEGLNGDIKNLNILKELAGKKLNKKFYQQNTLKVAKELLGKYLIVKRKNSFKIGKIIETEAYMGPDDKASHASRGQTPRNQIMFGPAGRTYIYLIYGIYHCLNIVTEKKGYPAAVLIRAVEAVFGLKEKTDGPGKLCREFNLTKKDNNKSVTQNNEIYIKDTGQKPIKIIAAPRIGVDYAGEWAKKKWRFVARF